jgi:hypothetical protein
MPRVVLVILLTLAAAVVAQPAETPCALDPFFRWPPPSTSDYRIRHGDDPAWARPDLDDSGWKAIDSSELPARAGIYWVRLRMKVPPSDPARPRDTLGLAIVASYDVYWDGHLLGRSGVVGSNRDAEHPGPVDNTFRIPDELSRPGEHVIALRLSSFHTGFPGPTYGVTPRLFALRDYLAYRSGSTAFSLVAVGGAFVVGLVFGLMWLLADRGAATGLFSLLCFTVATQQLVRAFRGLIEYPYSWHYPRLLAIALLVGLLGLLLIAFLQVFFRAPRSAWRLGVAAVWLAIGWQLSPLYHVKAIAMCAGVLVLALVITFFAWREKRRGAGYVLVGLLISFLGFARSPRDFLEHSFVFTSGVPMLGCVTALTLKLRDQNRAARQAQLAAARLEIELLKKNIQPHFVLNTLATLMEVVEQDPKTAARLIEALASEFRLLNRISGETLIPLAQEIELCRAHLEVMSLRHAARCSLEVMGVNDRALVPPALFLTLVENGLTHLLPRDGQLGFELRGEQRANGYRYTLVVHGERQPGLAADERAPREGTGLRYIKARLEESFTGQWSIESGATTDGWATTIALRGPLRLGPPATTSSLQPSSVS